MTRRLQLQNFDSPAPPAAPEPAPAPPAIDPAALEKARMEGYETGYKTGWDDAVAAAEKDQKTVSAELSRNLRDLNFTYFEAREEVLNALTPFLTELLETLFPEMLPEVASAAIASDLAKRAGESCPGLTRILVCPDDAETVTNVIGGAHGEKVEIVPEPALASGQVRIHSGLHDVVIDGETLIANLRQVLAGEAPEGDDLGGAGDDSENADEGMIGHG